VGALNAAMLAEGRGVEGVADLERLWRDLDGNESIYVSNPQFAEVGADTLGAWKSWLSNLAGSVLLGSPGVPIVALDSPSIEGSENELLTDIDAIESINLKIP
jgi:hypothetical protein